MTDFRLTTDEPANLLLDLGQHPVSHKFLQQKQQQETTWPIRLGIGIHSGLVGLIDPPPWNAIKPIYPWIKCNEPEEHLDNLTDILGANIGASAAKDELNILGLSQKDLTLLQRLQSRGLGKATLFDHPDIAANNSAGVESVQAVISESNQELFQSHQKYDLIVARHILEHTTNTRSFLNNITDLLTDNGNLVLEVPDNEKAFQARHHTIIWEEHSLYFTENTLCQLLKEYGLNVTHCLRYPMALEDILVVVVNKPLRLQKKFVSSSEGHTNSLTLTQTSAMQDFTESFDETKQKVRQRLLRMKQEMGGLTVLGAGHFGAAFINYYGLADVVDAVIDDDPNKQSLYMPGSRLPIQNSEKLKDGSYLCCLLTCNPWNNQKIASRNETFIAKGGRFFSVFQLEEWL